MSRDYEMLCSAQKELVEASAKIYRLKKERDEALEAFIATYDALEDRNDLRIRIEELEETVERFGQDILGKYMSLRTKEASDEQ